MSLHKNIEWVKHIDSLIRIKAKGSPKELATKVGIARSVLFEFMNEMKEKDSRLLILKMKTSTIVRNPER